MTFILFTLVELETIVNPYYALGELHNQALDYVIDNLPASPTRKDIVNAVSEYFASISSDTSAIGSVSNKVFAADFLNQTQCCNGIMEDSNLSIAQKEVISKLINPPTDVTGDDLELYYVKQENDIHNSALTAQEKQLPLIGVAIARASSAYWNAQAAAGVASPWNDVITGTPSPGTALAKWVKGDIAGAVGGGVKGGLYSWWTGGGIVVGVVLGAVVGAAMKSAEVAIFGA